MGQSLALEYCSLHSLQILGEVCSPLIFVSLFWASQDYSLPPRQWSRKRMCWSLAAILLWPERRSSAVKSSVFWTCRCASLPGLTGRNNSSVFTRLTAIAPVLVIRTGYSFNPCFAVSSGAFTHRHFHSCFIQTNLSISVTKPNTGRGKDINFFNKPQSFFSVSWYQVSFFQIN